MKDGKSPYELWFGVKPDLSRLRRFGSKCYVLKGKHDGSEILTRSELRRFVGFRWDSDKIVRTFNPITKKVTEESNVVFYDDKPNITS